MIVGGLTNLEVNSGAKWFPNENLDSGSAGNDVVRLYEGNVYN